MTKRRKRETAEAEESGGKRITMRRRGFPMKASSESEGMPRDINQEIQEAAAQPPTPLPTPAFPTVSPTDTGEMNMTGIEGRENFTPRDRLRQVGRRSSEYEREYRLDLIHRMLMRNIPLDEIAQQLGFSVSQIIRDRAELRDRWRQAARELNIDEIVGDNVGTYKDIVGMALRAASNASQPLPMRLSAMRTAVTAQNDMHRFLQAAGVYDVLRFRRAPGTDGQSDIQRMMRIADELMAESVRERREAVAPNPLGDFSGTDSNGNEL